MRHYLPLTEHQRYQIVALMKAGLNQTEIADTLEAHKSTISREIRRNRGGRGYRPKQAQRLAAGRMESRADQRCPVASSRCLLES